MSPRVFRSYCHFIIISWSLIVFFCGGPALAGSIRCEQVFNSSSQNAAQTLFSVLADYSLVASKQKQSAVNEILESNYWHDRTRRLELISNLKKIGIQEPSLKSETDKLQILFSLPYYGVKEWSDVLLRDLHPYNERVLDHAKKLSANEKEQIIFNLGQAWAKDRNRDGIHVIHALLDPYSIYQSFISKGKSGLEFYEYYLNKVKMTAFPQVEVGGYSGQKVLEISQILQRNLIGQFKNGVQIKAMNFFGSVVNGFARADSDLDVFNHLNYKDFPPMAESEFVKYRFQIEDAQTQKVIEETALNGSPFHWYLKSDGQNAHEHFGSMSHIFSIHITEDDIQLRFYYKKGEVGPDHMPIWNYIDLNKQIPVKYPI